MGVGILTTSTFSATCNEIRAGKRTLLARVRISTDDTNQTTTRQVNNFYKFRTEENLQDPHQDHWFIEEVSGTRKGRNTRLEWHRLIRTIRSSRRKFAIWVSELDRFRDFAEFVSFWDEFLRDDDRVVLIIDNEKKVLSNAVTLNEQGFAMVMVWQAENHAREQSKKTSDGVQGSERYRSGKWGPTRKPVRDKIQQCAEDPAFLKRDGTLNISKVAEACDISRDTVRRRLAEKGS